MVVCLALLPERSCLPAFVTRQLLLSGAACDTDRTSPETASALVVGCLFARAAELEISAAITGISLHH